MSAEAQGNTDWFRTQTIRAYDQPNLLAAPFLLFLFLFLWCLGWPAWKEMAGKGPRQSRNKQTRAARPGPAGCPETAARRVQQEVGVGD